MQNRFPEGFEVSVAVQINDAQLPCAQAAQQVILPVGARRGEAQVVLIGRPLEPLLLAAADRAHPLGQPLDRSDHEPHQEGR